MFAYTKSDQINLSLIYRALINTYKYVKKPQTITVKTHNQGMDFIAIKTTYICTIIRPKISLNINMIKIWDKMIQYKKKKLFTKTLKIDNSINKE